MFIEYLNKLKEHEKTPSLTEMAANAVYYKVAQVQNIPVKDLGLPCELVELCEGAPLSHDIQSRFGCKSKEVKDFLETSLALSTDEIYDLLRGVSKRKRQKFN